MIGWVAASGGLSLEPYLLFFIIFFWTPPHFWALSLTRVDDYARAGVPMLPVTAGLDATRRQILLYTIVLAAFGLAPWLLGYHGAVYGAIALSAGAAMIALALRVRSERDSGRAEHAAGRLFGFSILYLFIVFAALLIDARFAVHPT